MGEGNNVTLKCAAVGQPSPTIIWRRERGKPLLSVGSKESECCALLLGVYCIIRGCQIGGLSIPGFIAVLVHGTESSCDLE